MKFENILERVGRSAMKNSIWLWIACLMIPSGISLAQTKSQLMSTPMAAATTPSWNASLPGKWTYRSYLNRADIIVGDDPEPAVRNLAAIFGQGSTANSAVKA